MYASIRNYFDLISHKTANNTLSEQEDRWAMMIHAFNLSLRSSRLIWSSVSFRTFNATQRIHLKNKQNKFEKQKDKKQKTKHTKQNLRGQLPIFKMSQIIK